MRQSSPQHTAFPCRQSAVAGLCAMSRSLPRGVEIHGKRLRIYFMFQGKCCRMVINATAIDAQTIEEAARLREQIVAEIRSGEFNYRQRFPTFKTALALAAQPVGQAKQGTDPLRNASLEEMTVREGVAAWLETKRLSTARSTYVNYVSKAQHLLEALGERHLRDVTTQELQQLRSRWVRSRHNPEGLSPKTVNDILTIVRGVWGDAASNDITGASRANGVSNHRLRKRSQADPFSLEEMQRLLLAETDRPALLRLLIANCWMGLSVSELLALAVEDVDLAQRKLHVRRAWVMGEYRVPKEATRERTIDLLEPARQILHVLLPEAAKAPICVLDVTERDNLSLSTHRVRPLVRHPDTGQPWSTSTLNRWFRQHQERAGVRPRGANQCRHTFASRALSTFAPQEWVIRQQGHRDAQMLHEHYATWLPDTRAPRCIDQVNQAMTQGWAVQTPSMLTREVVCSTPQADLPQGRRHLKLVI